MGGGLSKLKRKNSVLTSEGQAKLKHVRAFPQEESSMDAYSGGRSKLKRKTSTPTSNLERIRAFHDVLEADQEKKETLDGYSGGLSKLKRKSSALTSEGQAKPKHVRAFPQEEPSMDAYSGG